MNDANNQDRFAGEVSAFTLQDFERALRAALEQGAIEVRAEEDALGTRTLHAWKTDNPAAVSMFPIDDVRLGPYQVDMVAQTIRKSLN
jgi:hypothetical protein